MARDCRPDANNPKRVDTVSVELHTFGDALLSLCQLKVPCFGMYYIKVSLVCIMFFVFRLLVKSGRIVTAFVFLSSVRQIV